jgi:hypothetical protein
MRSPLSREDVQELIIKDMQRQFLDVGSGVKLIWEA